MEQDISARLESYAIIRTINRWRVEGRLEEDIIGEIHKRHSDHAERIWKTPARDIADEQLDKLHELEVAKAYLTIHNINGEHDRHKLRNAMDGKTISGDMNQSSRLRRIRDTARKVDKIGELPVANSGASRRRGSVVFNAAT